MLPYLKHSSQTETCHKKRAIFAILFSEVHLDLAHPIVDNGIGVRIGLPGRLRGTQFIAPSKRAQGTARRTTEQQKKSLAVHQRNMDRDLVSFLLYANCLLKDQPPFADFPLAHSH